MLEFDRGLKYQYVMFFDEADALKADALDSLPGLLSAPVVGSRALGLRLGPSKQEQGIMVQSTGQLTPVTTTSWKGGSGVWLVTWSPSPSRLDVSFDARGLADVMGEDPPTLQEVAARICENLGRAATSLGPKVSRLALVTSAESSCLQEHSAAFLVANRFFSEALVEEAKANRLQDATGKANIPGKISLPDLADVPINKLETGTAHVLTDQDGTTSTWLAWQLDFNTSIAFSGRANFSEAGVKEFFGLATAWISGQLEALRGVTG